MSAGPGEQDVMAGLRALDAGTAEGYARMQAGDYPASYAIFHDLWERAKQALDAGVGGLDRGSPFFARYVAPSLIELLAGLTVAASSQARWGETEAASVEALQLLGEAPGSEMQRAGVLNSLGAALQFQQRLAEAETRYGQAADLFRAAGDVRWWETYFAGYEPADREAAAAQQWAMAVQALANRAACAKLRGDAPEFFLRIGEAIDTARAHGLADLERSLKEREDLFRRGLTATGERRHAAMPPVARAGPSTTGEMPEAAALEEESIDSILAAAASFSAKGDGTRALLALRDALARPELALDPRKHFFALIDLADHCADGRKDRKPADRTRRIAEGVAAADRALERARDMLLGDELTKIALKSLVMLLHQSDDPAHARRAAEELERLCALGPGDEAVSVLLDRAWHHAGRGDHAAALEDIDRASSLVPTATWRRIVDLSRIAVLTKFEGHAEEALRESLEALGPGGSFYAENLTDEQELTTWRGQLNALESLQGNAAVLLARAGRVAEAFHHAEEGKARRLRAVLAAEDSHAPTPTRAVELAGLREALLADNAAMALFWVGASEVLVLTIDPREPEPRAHFVPLPSKELRGLIETSKLEAWDEADIAALSGHLMPALRGVVDGCKGRGATLYLVPDAELFAAPFAALRGDGPDGPTIADQCALAYVPSATLWMWLRSRRAGVGPRSCLVAVTGTTRDAAGREVSFEPQARAVASLLGVAEPLVDPSKEAFLAAARGPTVIHLESHGRIDPGVPGVQSSSYLKFPGDARLTAKEILDELGGRPPAELVFLNACLSGRFSPRLRGEAAGLWEAFLRAGALSIVATLMEVDPRAASALAGAFYCAWLAGGVSKAEALRRAQVEVRKAMPAATDWASHILIGLHD